MLTVSARLRRAILGAALVGLALFHDTTATATVTQVDGVILPTGTSLQTFFNANDNQVNAIRDAAEQPQVFLPRTDRAVEFQYRIHNAGFNNSLGWYNVGDDIFSAAGRAANLHPVFGCGVPMFENPATPARQHRGNPDHYVQNADQGSAVDVDFAVERTSGRYKGGFIGLYLIAPEENPSSVNCGDFKDDSSGQSLFGHIYYSQKELNDDGDYVHHLVWTSVVNPELFYFGFEDSFRGNDNDFNDMFVSIDGLRPPCVPTTEICDGRDNDCDNLVDAADPDLSGVNEACLCDNADLPCSDGVVQGACQVGVTVCLAATIQCDARGAPTSETCDGVDQDCNGAIDNDPAGAGGTCDGGDEDLCLEGTVVCENAQLICTDNTDSTVETCNDEDDDCDSVTDENPIDEGDRCGTDTGLCVAGTEICMDGELECVGDVGPEDEVCNLLDDDCDGSPDDNPIDATGPCEGTDVGECVRGTLECSGGVVTCVGAQGPVTEICNRLDDDCDGVNDNDPVDVGQVCGESRGECDPGRFVCTDGMLVCEGGDGPTAELCNGLDDDCNGTIDNDPAGVGVECDGGLMHVCRLGEVECIAGSLQCVGAAGGTTEVCDGMDNDCDGETDNGDLCGDGECIDGRCTVPCAAGEFPCPIGQTCNDDGFCVPDPCLDVVCDPGPNGEVNVCDEGVCVPICDGVTCSGSNVCRPTDGRCVPNNCEFLPLCTEDQLCVDRQCVSDPCADVDCADDQFCRAGTCVDSCAGVDCVAGQVCRDGACVATGCPDDCPNGQVCSAAMGRCINDPCTGVRCDTGDVCDPATGQCIADPCLGIECPAEQFCELGNCFLPEVPMAPDAGPRELVTPGGGGGCDAGGGGDAPLLPVLILLALVCLRRHAAALLAIVTLAVTVSACDVNDYCVNCGVTGDDDGGMVGDDDGGVDGPSIDARVDGPPPVNCDAGEIGDEICNGLDDDCDSVTDEGFVLLDDPLNCGVCGKSCALDGTLTQCTSGQCVINGCAAGAVDVNGDIDGPFDDSDGCEYECFVSNGGNEVCDTLDNDCNGATDEGFDLQGDETNCGECGRVCSFFHATGTCTTGDCGFRSPEDCDPGFHDIDGLQPNGCEYSCTPTSPSTEVCDALDNNCNGTADEGFNTQTDPLNCGACGRVCSFPGVATPRCGAGACFFTRPTDCAPGFVDLNNRQSDGCEYRCTATGAETCDGADNDCNGVVDDGIAGVGDMCASTPDGVPRGVCTLTGTVVCVAGTGLVCDGAPRASVETCDGLDNDCDGATDDAETGGGPLTRTCYSGPAGTGNVGVCRRGTQTCTGGQFPVACAGEILPGTETCNADDDDCDARVDENPTRTGPLSRECYTGAPGTEDVGVCHGGTQTCAGGDFGTCLGQVVNSPVDACGDDLDTDCDGSNDTAEGCLDIGASELRLDGGSGSGSNGSDPGEDHSFDFTLVAGGSPLGSRVHAVWNDLGAGQADVFFRSSADGGATWGTVVNVTSGVSQPAVEPVLVVAPGAGAGSADRLFVVFQTFTNNLRDIRVMRSNDGGASWALISGDRLDANDDDSFHHHAAVSSDGATLAVTWERLNTTSFARDIQSRVSTNAGAGSPTFSSARTINQDSSTPARAGRPQVAITSTGRLVWVWREARDMNSAANGIFSAWSDTPGGTLNPRRLDGSTTPADAEPPQLVAVGQSTYVVWQDIATTAGQGSDILFVRSVDNAATWTTERILDDPSGEVSSSFSPSIAVFDNGGGASNDRVAVAWEDRRSGVQAFVAVSSNNGTSFGTPVRASSQNGDAVPGQTLTPKVEFATASTIVVAYVNDRDAGAFHVYATSSVDAGASWSVNDDELDQGDGDALGPVVARAVGGAFANSAVAVGWVDFRTNGERGDPYLRRTGR